MAATTTADYLYETTTIAPATFDLPTTTATYSNAAAAAASLLDLSDSSITPTKIVARLLHAGEESSAHQQQQLEEQQQQHNQITFEIPSHHDLEHINTLHKFNTLLKRIGNVAYDTITSRTVAASVGHAGESGSTHSQLSLPPLGVDATGQHITSEQISKSAVLNLADLKGGSGGGSFLEELFGDADMHVVINYLWIGVVTALVVLSVIFILFSCYFYRKFRQWKKCNKDIRNHLHNDLYADGHIVACDRLIDAHGQHTATAGGLSAAAAAYYQQIESPPCYTIATGLPTYDEALHHNHHHHEHHGHQSHQHFAYAMKFMYPTIAGIYNNNCMLKQQNSVQQQQDQQLMKQQSYKKVSPMAEGAAAVAVTIAAIDEAAEGYLPATTYECDDIAELHSMNYPAAAMGVAAPLLGGVNASASASVNADAAAEKSALLEEVITIRLDDMTPEITLAATQQQQMSMTATASTTATSRNPLTLLYFNEQQRLWQQQQTAASGITEQQQQRSSAATIA